jgi:hypothetical protein
MFMQSNQLCSVCGRKAYILRDKWYCRWCAKNHGTTENKLKQEYKPEFHELEDDVYKIQKIVERRLRVKAPDEGTPSWVPLNGWLYKDESFLNIFKTDEGQYVMKVKGGVHTTNFNPMDQQDFNKWIKKLLESAGYKIIRKGKKKEGYKVFWIP